MAKGVVGESELKRTISNDTNIFKETRSNAIQELLHLTVFFKSVPSGATEQILSKTLAKLCKLGFRNKRLFFAHVLRYFRAHDFSFILYG